jgi:hypothetical protein
VGSALEVASIRLPTNAPNDFAGRRSLNFLGRGANAVLSVSGQTNYASRVIHDDDIPNKAYVDNTAAGIHVHAEVHVILKNSTLAAATGGTVAYTNGNDGVGAKLTVTGGTSVVDALNTACGTDPDLTIDGRVIIAGETNAAWNGIYTISATNTMTVAP